MPRGRQCSPKGRLMRSRRTAARWKSGSWLENEQGNPAVALGLEQRRLGLPDIVGVGRLQNLKRTHRLPIDRSHDVAGLKTRDIRGKTGLHAEHDDTRVVAELVLPCVDSDRKSTRLQSSHL